MVITIEEDIGIKKINGFYQELKEIIKKESEIIFDFKDVNRIDLSFAQVMIAADKELKKKTERS